MEPNTGDMSQLGLRRGRLLPDQCMPFFNSCTVEIVDRALILHPVIARMVTDPTALTKAVKLVFSFDTSAIGLGSLTDEQIHSLQEALLPKNTDLFEKISQDPALIEFNEKLTHSLTIDAAIFGAYLTSLLGTNQSLLDFLSGQNIVGADEATISTQATIDVDQLEKAEYSTLLAIKAKTGNLPESVQKSYLRLEYAALMRSFGFTETLSVHPVVEDLFKRLYAENLTKVYVAPEWLAAVVASGASYAKMPFIVSATDTDDAGLTPLEPKPSRFATELLIWASMHRHTTHPIPEHNYEVAFTRMLVLRHSLHRGSEENGLFVYGNRENIPLDFAAVTWFIDSFRKPEAYYAGMFTSAISFLKSGHHANAFGVDNWLMKILNALNIQVDIAKSARMVNSCVYWGTHPANMLLLVNYLYLRAKNEGMTGAITYRMHPVPPMFAGICNLELFMEALNAVGFFDMMNKSSEFTEFKAHMNVLRKTMHLCAPYAHYLYGLSSQTPIESKNAAARYAAYATAIDAVLPSGTLNLSPSLRKLALESGKNAIAANLQVEAFVKGYRRFHSLLIEGRMRATIPKGIGLITE
jgi:hypothetical protein